MFGLYFERFSTSALCCPKKSSEISKHRSFVQYEIRFPLFMRSPKYFVFLQIHFRTSNLKTWIDETLPPKWDRSQGVDFGVGPQ